jgi:hypothetical protein
VQLGAKKRRGELGARLSSLTWDQKFESLFPQRRVERTSESGPRRTSIYVRSESKAEHGPLLQGLKCGGPDAVSNMQWQTTADAKAKNRWETKGCARQGRASARSCRSPLPSQLGFTRAFPSAPASRSRSLPPARERTQTSPHGNTRSPEAYSTAAKTGRTSANWSSACDSPQSSRKRCMPLFECFSHNRSETYLTD